MANKPGFWRAGPLDIAADGFTLLEVIIAISIMVLCFSSILAVESNAINATARARTMNTVQMLARNQLIETEYQIQGHLFDEIKKEDTGVFKEPFQDFSWKTEVKEIDFPNLTSLATAGAGGGDAGGGGSAPAGNGIAPATTEQPNSDVMNQVTRNVTKYLSDALREVTVTISWKKGSGEQHYSISTYWVDLNHEFQIQ